MVTVGDPRLRQRRLDYGAAVTAPAKVGMCDHVVQVAVTPTLAKQVRHGDQHASRRNPRTLVGYEHVDASPLERLPPNGLRTFERLDRRAHFRRGEQLEQRRQVGGASKASTSHSATISPFDADVQPEAPIGFA